MHRQPLLRLLQNYAPSDANEAAMKTEIIDFVQQHPDCFERSLSKGHITASAWLVDEQRSHVLMTHHRKLDRWLQPGGHADGETDVFKVALTEATEETGLSSIRAINSEIFDVDVHLIPSHGTVAAHWHYDIRFLLEADARQALVVPERESKQLRWMTPEEVIRLNGEGSLLRMVDKLSRQTK